MFRTLSASIIRSNKNCSKSHWCVSWVGMIYEGRTESHEQLFFASELGTADEGEYGGRWNQLLCYP